MRQEEIWDVDAAQRYDTPGTGMFAPEVLGPTVDFLADLAGDGRALEFAIGTGRVAIPLAERGVPVAGIELSPPMADRLSAKADEERSRSSSGTWPGPAHRASTRWCIWSTTRSPTC
jgi:SAM-dependent methyltransferase